MLYLVKTDSYPGFGPQVPPEQIVPLAQQEVIPTMEALVKLRQEGKILAGGVPAGDRAHIFIVDAASNDEVTELIQSLPLWGRHVWDVTPLESWEHHAAFIRQTVAQIQ